MALPAPPQGPPAPPPRPPRAGGARTLGRRVAMGVYYALVVAVSLVGAVEVTQQVLFQPAPTAPYPACRDGLRALYASVVRARDAAAHTGTGEDAALARFRDALEPAWTYRDGVAARCRGSAKDEGTLDAIERLRYAEEHAVRREAEELAPLRRRVQAIIDGEIGPGPTSVPPGVSPGPGATPSAPTLSAP